MLSVAIDLTTKTARYCYGCQFHTTNSKGRNWCNLFNKAQDVSEASRKVVRLKICRSHTIVHKE